jgi:hypothetical protein
MKKIVYIIYIKENMKMRIQSANVVVLLFMEFEKATMEMNIVAKLVGINDELMSRKPDLIL